MNECAVALLLQRGIYIYIFDLTLSTEMCKYTFCFTMFSLVLFHICIVFGYVHVPDCNFCPEIA